MFVNEISIRVRYAETDQMGYVYYGNYAQYYEVGRVEALRSLGMSYKEMEANGIMLPVISFNIKYFKPAFYDDTLIIKTFIKEIPSVKISFHYECYKNEILINEGDTVLVFINKHSNKPCPAPPDFIQKISKFFQ